jgi:hypothetical protein
MRVCDGVVRVCDGVVRVYDQFVFFLARVIRLCDSFPLHGLILEDDVKWSSNGSMSPGRSNTVEYLGMSPIVG